MADNLPQFRFETQVLHAGQQPDPTTHARGVPVYRTSSYVFRDTEHAQNLFALKELGNIYTRIMNPTQAVLEERVAALEGGAAGLALASGTSAVHYAIINIAEAGDEIVSSNDLYGGTFTMFDAIHPQLGIKTNWVDPRDPENFAKAITPKTKAIFVESCANPALNVPDFERIAEIAAAHNLPLLVDNTFPTPYLFRPFEHGANVSIHSLTKWLGGHGAGIGGVLVDGANFNWGQEKFPLYDKPEKSYHGLRFGHDLGELQPVAYIIRARVVPLRNLGACISPDNAWFFLQGIETLPMRIERHSENGFEIAKWLREHKQVEWVTYPGFEEHETHANAKKYLKSPDGRNFYGSMVSFGIKGGREAGRKLIDSLKLFSHLANVGDAKSLAIHPATTTHSQLNDEELDAGGIRPELVRLSVGLEHPDDLKWDLDQAITTATS